MDVSRIKGAHDWDFPVPEITAEAIDDFIAALARDERLFMDIYYDAVDSCSREMSNERDEMVIRNYYLGNEWMDDVRDAA
ncbi:hypothetical protein GCM10007377_14770 [Galliscardovia ingluviei]|uniref:Uncharacterized protein n=1 Tax=Galliscardovia ingluviei TaxID=1769422 RepID=A0A8J3F082_9BIFI|nr:hypothetical protein [Galliscardovia ingluviei]GGI15211.1 hypothetical protein GCM10007377_14770 [Galliscardovia ingluviei]